VPNKLTIRDIARLAQVSTATVSRVLNHKPDVDPATRERVLQIVKERGFVPSIAASSLAGGRSRLLGVLVPSLTWPLMPNIMQGIAEVIEQTSYELMLYSISHRRDRSELMDSILATRLVDGLIAVYPDGVTSAEPTNGAKVEASAHLADLYAQGFPVVILDDQSLPGRTPWVGPHNRIGAYQAVRHLVGLGHRRIAHVQGPAQYQCSHDRDAGYRQALEEAGIEVDPALVLEGDFNAPGGQAAGAQLLGLPNRPTAIFAANDQMACGVLSAAQARGLRVPGDVAIVGFDDAALAVQVRPTLTTVRQPFQEMGKRAADLLLALVDAPRMLGDGWLERMMHLTEAQHGGSGMNPPQIQLPTELIVRESSGPPAQ
jgi:LacI family transcriptional regulator